VEGGKGGRLIRTCRGEGLLRPCPVPAGIAAGATFRRFTPFTLKGFFAIFASLCTIAGLGFGIYRSVCAPPVPPQQSAPATPQQQTEDDALYDIDDEAEGESVYSEGGEISEASTPEEPLPVVEAETDDAILNEAQLIAQAAKLSDAPLWAQWLTQSTPCRRILRAMDDIVQGQRPIEALDFLTSEQPFSAQRDNAGRYTISASAIARFQPAIDIIAAIPPKQLAQLYLKAEPLLQEEYRKLGSRENVRSLLSAFCAAVLAIPKFDHDPALIRVTETLYRYEDPAFERLTDGQKLIVRTGYKNCATIRALCQALSEELGLEQ
jgi:hypothetical protein